MHFLGFERHVPLWIEISVEVPARLDAVEDLGAADLDHAVAAHRVQSRSLRVEYDLPHGGIYPSGEIPRQARISLTCFSAVDSSPLVSITKSARRRFSSSGICRSRIERS